MTTVQADTEDIVVIVARSFVDGQRVRQALRIRRPLCRIVADVPTAERVIRRGFAPEDWLRVVWVDGWRKLPSDVRSILRPYYGSIYRNTVTRDGRPLTPSR